MDIASCELSDGHSVLCVSGLCNSGVLYLFSNSSLGCTSSVCISSKDLSNQCKLCCITTVNKLKSKSYTLLSSNAYFKLHDNY